MIIDDSNEANGEISILEEEVSRSYKFPMLQHIFDKYTEKGTKETTQNHTFTFQDLVEAFKACQIDRPISTSNFVLDLTRQDRGIGSRLPASIIEYGYDLRKKTGRVPGTRNLNYNGEFVFVGKGNALHSWHHWNAIADLEIIIENKVPRELMTLLGNDEALLGRDEGALFSAIDYCDVLSFALYGKDQPGSVLRVQAPKKWQPNEIDGLYYSSKNGLTLYPTEAKALTTGDQLNLEQMLGALNTIREKIPNVTIVPLGIQMIENGMRIGKFRETSNRYETYLEIISDIKVIFDPPVIPWHRTAKKRRQIETRSATSSLFSALDL
jgi:hypothetical protein